MLVLTRKEDESIEITSTDGTMTKVIVKRIKGGRVTLAIDALCTVRIKRSELPDRPHSPSEVDCA